MPLALPYPYTDHHPKPHPHVPHTHNARPREAEEPRATHTTNRHRSHGQRTQRCFGWAFPKLNLFVCKHGNICGQKHQEEHQFPPQQLPVLISDLDFNWARYFRESPVSVDGFVLTCLQHEGKKQQKETQSKNESQEDYTSR
ncbi:unnamed protein product [Lota lota]